MSSGPGLWLSLSLVVMALPAAPAPARQSSIDEFLEAFALEWTRGNPQAATWAQAFEGAEQDALDRKLTPVTDEYQRQRVELARRGLVELGCFDRTRLTPVQRVSADMLAWQLDDLTRGAAFLELRFPFEQTGGVQRRLVDFLTNAHPLRNPRDAENYVARLGQVGPRINDARAVAAARGKKGIRPPRFILVATIDQMERFVAPAPRQNLLVTSLAERAAKIEALSPDARTKLAVSAEALVRDSVYPAYRRAIALLKDQLPSATDDAGLWRLPRGDAAYAQFIRTSTSSPLTPDEVHAIGLREVARIDREMDMLLREIGLTEGAVADRMQRLQAQAAAYPDEPDVRAKVLADYEDIIRDAERRCAPLFDLRPKAPVTVRREREYSEANAAPHYSAAAKDGSRPGIFWVPLPGPTFRKSIGRRTLAYHEAVPGHHFQAALQQEMTDLPRFRRDGTFGSGAGAYSEGWALYAERLAAESGWYEGDPSGRLGQLAAERFRARRLVVDTGLHSKRWTRQQAIDYGISAIEVDRYVVWPGQACSYMIGELKILELREKARRVLGDRFSLREFHSLVLRTGAVPLPILEQVIDSYLESTR